MDVKTLIVKSSTDLFEKRVKEYLEKGYILKESNICIEKENTIVNGNSWGNKTTFYYYALFIKE